MDEREFKRRTKRVALEVLALVERLPTKRMPVASINALRKRLELETE